MFMFGTVNYNILPYTPKRVKKRRRAGDVGRGAGSERYFVYNTDEKEQEGQEVKLDKKSSVPVSSLRTNIIAIDRSFVQRGV